MEWQPIATAPRDGSDMLLTDGNWVRTGWFATRINAWSIDAVVAMPHPTHWMPLPPLPNRSTAKPRLMVVVPPQAVR